MTGGVLSNLVVGKSVLRPYACLDVTTYRIGSGFSVGRCVKVCGRVACLRGTEGRCCGRPSVGLQSSLTHAWHDSRMCSKVLLQLVPDASGGKEHHGPLVVDDLGGQYEEGFDDVQKVGYIFSFRCSLCHLDYRIIVIKSSCLAYQLL